MPHPPRRPSPSPPDERRRSTDLDVFMAGTVFLDIVFTGLDHRPAGGEEMWSTGMGSAPGGIANLAVAASRLGLRTGLAAAFGDDAYGDFCWSTLAEQEGVDLSRSRRFPHWHTPVTVSMADAHDRAMVTHGHPPPVDLGEMIGAPPRSAAAIADLGMTWSGGESARTWVQRAKEQGTLVFADLGFDPTGAWDRTVLEQLRHCHAFMPNAVEAMAYTRTETPQEALYAIADLVPLAIVTNGAHGALALDTASGEEVAVPALRTRALDPTGAGDVFGAAVVVGTLERWPLVDRISFASLCAALAVQHFGGSLAAPGWGDIADWWADLRSVAGATAYEHSLLRRFAFLDDVIPTGPIATTRRAEATLAHLSDLPHPDGAAPPPASM
ncbi:PfkB family carbohydrate kinase [Intrasporangium calvum]|uniref:PfkB family carbohydrate kinase n=1 Tax=Intrasporangium calvum TaxID=53358 RepID=A0ABT5GHW5_9MICO|nr:PfkB family carbohydrate kinase [Intrasporangium calvum]